MIALTDSQLQTLSSEYIQFPQQLVSANQGLAAATAAQASFLAKDQNSISFQNHQQNILTQYHWELANLNGQKRSNYDVGNVEKAARMQSGNLHFQQGWTFLYPKLDQSNIGNPISSYANNENTQIAAFQNIVNIMLNGIPGNGSSISTVTTDVQSGNIFYVSQVSQASVGDIVVIYDGASICSGTIVSISNLDPKSITLNLSLSPLANIASGATVVGFLSGFSNAQRAALPTTPDFTSVRAAVDYYSTQMKSPVSNQLDALKANDSGDPSNQSAASNVQSFLSAINNWQNGPSNTRYTDAVLNPFLSTISSRLSQVSSRAQQIPNLLGQVFNQNSDGSLGGSGYYFEAFKWVDARCNIATGTLRQYYNSALSLQAAQSIINAVQQKKSTYDSMFLIQLFSADAVGSNSVGLVSSVGFRVGSRVKVIADNQAVITANILANSIADNILSFDTMIPVAYTKSANARVLMALG